MQSTVKIRDTVGKISKHAKERPSRYFHIVYFINGVSYSDDNDKRVFKVVIEHEQIGNESLERSQPYTLKTLEQTINKKITENTRKKEESA